MLEGLSFFVCFVYLFFFYHCLFIGVGRKSLLAEVDEHHHEHL
jgi:hypothetical protein